MANLAAARLSVNVTSKFLRRLCKSHSTRTVTVFAKSPHALVLSNYDKLRLSNQQKVLQNIGTNSTALRHRSYYENWTYLKYEDLVALIDSGDIVLIDVRDSVDISEQGAFPKAINIPLPQLKEALKMKDEDFEAKFNVSKPKQDDTNIVFAGFKSLKSNSATEIAHKLGFTKSRQYKNGFEEWNAKQSGEKYGTGTT